MPKRRRIAPSRTRPRRTKPKAGRGAAAAAAAPATQAGNLVFRTLSGKAFSLPVPADLREPALRWTYALRNRQRWVEHDRSREAQAAQARSDLLQLGLTEEALEDLAVGDVVEVSVPYAAEKDGWEARIFPWEYVIAGATRESRARRGARHVLVVRHLELGRVRKRRAAPQRLTVVESAPGDLRALYSFETERRMVREEVGLASSEPVVDPTRAELRAQIVRDGPDVIHVTGFDTHQAAGLLGLPEDPHRRDGLLLEEGGPVAIPAPELAQLLSAASTPPELVAFNTYNSGARLAALTVAEGATTAIGFQDDIDDRLAEAFFALFYRTWRATGWNTLEAFRTAWKALLDQPRELRGTGVVLWSAHSLLEGRDSAEARRPPPRGRRSRRAAPADGPEPPTVEVEPWPELNYSLLHNNRGLFKTFILRRSGVHDVRGIHVAVDLHVGSEHFPFRTTVALKGGQPSVDLDREVRVPLTSALARAVRESVHTSLYIEVKWEKGEVYSHTHRVTLLPVDQWRDTKADRIWLPSFVLPRDPAVLRIVDAAQRYLMTLRDDSGAGFDGYQSLDNAAEDPAEGIDLQVQALWSALVHDFGLSYINPPPAYSQTDQRLRIPAEVVAGRRGTCIDLALLLASCLEYVDVYPVVFLLEGHAFPGYWRSDRDHEAFCLARPVSQGSADQEAQLAQGTTGEREPSWYFGRKENYDEILSLVRHQQLVPLETVSLTRRGSFWEAVDEGLTNLRSRREFQAMIDVTLARRNGVTPLPIRSEPA